METTFSKPVFAKNGSSLIRIRPEKIVCIEADGNYCNMFIDGVKNSICFTTAYCHIMEKGFCKHLLHIKRGVAVNVEYLESIEKCTLTMSNGKHYTLAECNVKDLLKRLEIYV